MAGNIYFGVVMSYFYASLLLTGVFFFIWLFLLCIWIAKKRRRPLFDLDIAILGHRNVGKTIFLCTLLDKILQGDSLPDDFSCFYLWDQEEKKLRGEISVKEEVSESIGVAHFDENLLNELESQQTTVLRSVFPCLSDKTIVQKHNARTWNIRDGNLEYTLIKESEKFALYPVYYAQGRRTTRESVMTELLRHKYQQQKPSIQTENFYINFTREQRKKKYLPKQIKSQFIDFPGLYFEQEDKYKINRIESVIQNAQGLIFVIHAWECIFENGDIVENDDTLHIYRKILEKKLAQNNKIETPIYIVLSQIEKLPDKYSIQETSQLWKFIPSIQKLLQNTSMFHSTYIDSFSKHSSNTFQNFIPFFQVLEKNLHLVQKKRYFFIRRIRRFFFLFFCLCILFGLESWNLFLYSRLNIVPLSHIVHKGELEAKESAISNQIQRLERYKKNVYSVSTFFYFTYRIEDFQAIVKRNLQSLVKEQLQMYSAMLANDVLTSEEIQKMIRTEQNLQLVAPEELEQYSRYLEFFKEWHEQTERNLSYQIRFCERCDQAQVTYLKFALKTKFQQLVQSKINEIIQMQQQNSNKKPNFICMLQKYIFYVQEFRKLEEYWQDRSLQRSLEKAFLASWEDFQQYFLKEENIEIKYAYLIEIYSDFPREQDNIFHQNIHDALFSLAYNFLIQMQKTESMPETKLKRLQNFIYYSPSSIERLHQDLQTRIKDFITLSTVDKKEQDIILETMQNFKKMIDEKIQMTENEIELTTLWANRIVDWNNFIKLQKITVHFYNYKIPQQLFANYDGNFLPYIKFKIPGKTKMPIWNNKILSLEFYVAPTDKIDLEIWNKNKWRFDTFLTKDSIPVRTLLFQESWQNYQGIQIVFQLDTIIKNMIPDWIKNLK